MVIKKVYTTKQNKNVYTNKFLNKYKYFKIKTFNWDFSKTIHLVCLNSSGG